MNYTVIHTDRKSISIRIEKATGEVAVLCPYGIPDGDIRNIVEARRGWIEAQLKALREQPALIPFPEAELHEMAAELIVILKERVPHFAKLLGVTYGKVTVRNQKSRWGSCSSQGNLNFNCTLAKVPPEVRDYVIVHELCHRLEMNHSPAFWAKVEALVPDYKAHRQWLKENGEKLIGRL